MSLPGVNTIIRDRFFTLSRTEIPVGLRIAAIGRRNTVTTQELDVLSESSSLTEDEQKRVDSVSSVDPYTATNEKSVIDIFGEESDLHRAYLELVAGGATRIVLIALPADTEFDHNLGNIDSSTHDSLTGGTGNLFEDAFAAAESARIDVIVPWGRGGGPTEFENPATPSNDAEIGFHADNHIGANSWAAKVAEQCAKITENSYPCFAVMGIAPYMGPSGADGSMTPAQVNSHLDVPDLIPRDHSALGTRGIYVSVIATEIRPLGYNRNHDFGFSNGAAMYAGYLAQLDSWSAPTGKAIFNTERIRYNPTRTQQIDLISKGLVPVALNFTRAATWVDAQTFSKTTSDYTRLTTLRIVFDAVQMVRQVAQQFIGEGMNTNTQNALDTAISGGLRGMQQLGAVLASDYTISYIPSESKAIVDLVLNPAFELRNLEVRVAVQL